MKSISVHVSEGDYQEFKSLAAVMDRPVAELIREAMSRYLGERRERGKSIFELEPHDSGRLLKDWTRSELVDEMLSR